MGALFVDWAPFSVRWALLSVDWALLSVDWVPLSVDWVNRPELPTLSSIDPAAEVAQ
ncbi:hypothetical protein VZC37_01375 [Gordonia sp. LSe1-13]|uniref:Uncharacterized protein n=1 Tax=Gordonia sesuvii TaxID=3116777 RepID=A0ABU7M777_9ACTN|nr:hypothetical protein [Gordonia sp. LSe1-13]